MGVDGTTDLLLAALTVLFMTAMPLLLVGLTVGVAISLLQAATQVQEASLVFVPKLIAVAATFWVMAPWMGDKIIGYVHLVFETVASMGGAGLR